MKLILTALTTLIMMLVVLSGCTPVEQTVGGLAGGIIIAQQAQEEILAAIIEARKTKTALSEQNDEMLAILAAGGVPLNPELVAEIKKIAAEDWSDPKVITPWAIVLASILGGGGFAIGKKKNGT